VARKSGNVPGATQARAIEQFAPGDVVKMREAVLTSGMVDMTPLVLFRDGWPNEFQVVEAFDSAKAGGPCVALKPCCLFMENHATGAKLCKGHPSEYFEKVRRERIPKKGDKAASVSVPWVGAVAGFRYHEDEDHPEASFHVMGREVKLEGVAAKFFKKIVDSYGIKI
jgi:hypothetical protein